MSRATHASPGAQQMRSAQRSALVTGAGRGIGRGIALALAEAGWAVVINYRGNAVTANETADLVREAGCDALVVQADIGAAADRARLVQAALDQFRPHRSAGQQRRHGPPHAHGHPRDDRRVLRRGDERQSERTVLPQPTGGADDAGASWKPGRQRPMATGRRRRRSSISVRSAPTPAARRAVNTASQKPALP